MIDLIINSITEHRWMALAAITIGLAVRLIRHEIAGGRLSVPTQALPWIALGLGQLGAMTDYLLTGSSLPDAALKGLVAASLAIAGHESIAKLLIPKTKKKGA
jgi:hypothetical protein